MKKSISCPGCGETIEIEVIVKYRETCMSVVVVGVHSVSCKIARLIVELFGLDVEKGEN